MAPDWHALCSGTDWRLEGPVIEVRFREGRRHRVTVHQTEDAYRLVGVVATTRHLPPGAQIPLLTWRRNRAVMLVGFRLLTSGDLVGEARAPRAGLTPAEFQRYVHAVAAECDRFEHLLTGADTE